MEAGVVERVPLKAARSGATSVLEVPDVGATGAAVVRLR